MLQKQLLLTTCWQLSKDTDDTDDELSLWTVK